METLELFVDDRVAVGLEYVPENLGALASQQLHRHYEKWFATKFGTIETTPEPWERLFMNTNSHATETKRFGKRMRLVVAARLETLNLEPKSPDKKSRYILYAFPMVCTGSPVGTEL